ncbi:hypothetical protein RUND412_008465 [Rhizina undulata]
MRLPRSNSSNRGSPRGRPRGRPRRQSRPIATPQTQKDIFQNLNTPPKIAAHEAFWLTYNQCPWSIYTSYVTTTTITNVSPSWNDPESSWIDENIDPRLRALDELNPILSAGKLPEIAVFEEPEVTGKNKLFAERTEEASDSEIIKPALGKNLKECPWVTVTDSAVEVDLDFSS